MNFNKQKTERKRESLSSPKLRRGSHLTLFFYKYALVVIIALIVTLQACPSDSSAGSSTIPRIYPWTLSIQKVISP